MLCQCVTLPLSVIATRQQTTYTEAPKPWSTIVRDIVKNDGPAGLFKGFGPAMILCSNPAITYGLFEKIKEFIIRRKRGHSAFLTASEAFAAGAISKVVATVVTFPYISAKTRLMWTPTKEEIERHGDDVIYKGSFDVLKKLYKLHGIKGWYLGMQIQIIKAFITQALVLMFKEIITKYIITTLNFLRKRRTA
ncbi:Mitochondrial substrate carrier family protein Q [Smittium culicis]|nr:Mitochondrial substrate carrier family protein Q [Smittium culicis]